MGSSSSKPQYHYPSPRTAQPIQAGYPYPAQAQGQFGYYIQQVGNDPSQVQAIPGYYYDAGYPAVPDNTAHRRHNSAPILPAVKANTAPPPPQQADQIPATSSEQDPASTPAAPADPVAESPPPEQAAAGASAESPHDNNATDQPSSQPPPAAPSVDKPAPSRRGRLPDPPRDIHTYRHPRRAQTSDSDRWGYYSAPVASVAYKPQLRSPYQPKRVPALRPPRPHEELIPKKMKSGGSGRGSGSGSGSGSGKGPFKLLRSLTLPLSSSKPKKFSSSSVSRPYPYATSKPRAPIPAFPSSPLDTSVAMGPPMIIPPDSPLNLTSPHKILYKKKLYPTAAHLFEAQKYLKHRPELGERIRTSGDDPGDMVMLSWTYQRDGMSRTDWAVVWRYKLDEVLYSKFIQHPNLRAELMATGYAPLLDGTEIPQPDAEGVNELGKALVRLRERLRREGAR